MEITGHLKKMVTALKSPVEYQLPLDDTLVDLNEHIGNSVSLNFSGEIHCIACGKKTNKSFNQGHCYPCFISLASCDMCILKPETCHYHKGTCREPEWADEHCMQDHFVYLANSSGIKVGITRHTQIPTRWIDQGASQALPVFRVANRMISGKLEVAIKSHVSDRTDWRKMLKGEPEEVDLKQVRDELLGATKDQIIKITDEHGIKDAAVLAGEEITSITYPVDIYPEKVRSLNLDKTPDVMGTLFGIKGQYLILDTGVLNIRKFTGYKVTFGVTS